MLFGREGGSGARARSIGLLLVVVLGLCGEGFVVDTPAEPVSAAASRLDSERAVTALGRIEPKDGVIRVAGPSQPTILFNVVSKLLVMEGDWVKAGDVIAVFDSYETKKATAARLKAELEHARAEHRRFEELYKKQFVAASERDAWLTRVDVAKAELERAEADLELSLVRSPIKGQILKIHTYPGERVERKGIVEIGQTDQMYAVAEVYEDDIGRVNVGQRAVIESPALPTKLHGTVEHIGYQVGKKDILDEDPAAKTDARVVEVKIKLDESERVARLTNLQVDVRIVP
jgi:HlyD family secretion protein